MARRLGRAISACHDSFPYGKVEDARRELESIVKEAPGFMEAHVTIATGIGSAGKIDSVEITWPQPSGKAQKIENSPDGALRDNQGKLAV